MKKSTGIIVGISLIAVAVLYVLKLLNLFDFELFFKGWWTLFIIIPSLAGIVNDRDKTGGFIGLSLGILLLLAARGVFEYKMVWKFILPIVLVIFGIRLIIGSVKSNKANSVESKIKNDGKEIKSGFSAFSGSKLNYNGEEFNGADLNAVFGGIDCDLRNAIINSDCVVNATAIFGGIDILVPDNVNVYIASNSLFGGVGDKRTNKTSGNPYTVFVNATGVFGGVDIK